MTDLSGAKAVVVGAGALGSAIAFELARQGAHVTQVDHRRLADNASGMAAGMLAPALESALDPASHGHFPLLRAARDLWPTFAEALETHLVERCGALLRAPPVELEQTAASLKASGARYERVGDTLFTAEDWRLEPRLTLAALRRGLVHHRGEARSGEVLEADGRSVRLASGEVLLADVVVLACGFGGLGLASELSALTPIKGQLLRFPDAGLLDGPILRSLLGYVVPSRDGAVVGATMEEGRTDVSLDRDALDRLKVEAGWLAPSLGLAQGNGFAGVRAATPDALPMFGRLSNGALAATGARRNGWLLAPLAAAVISRAARGEPLPQDARFDPARFSRRG